jgi:hypothetical protein
MLDRMPTMRTTRRECLALIGAALLVSCRDSTPAAPPKPQTLTLTVEGMT